MEQVEKDSLSASGLQSSDNSKKPIKVAPSSGSTLMSANTGVVQNKPYDDKRATTDNVGG